MRQSTLTLGPRTTSDILEDLRASTKEWELWTSRLLGVVAFGVWGFALPLTSLGVL